MKICYDCKGWQTDDGRPFGEINPCHCVFDKIEASPDICQNRHGGNPESVAAYNRLLKGKKKAALRVYEWIKKKGDTGVSCKELAPEMGVDMSTISGRFTELRKEGLIEKIAVRDGSAVYRAA